MQRHQAGPCLQFLAARLAVGSVNVKLTDISAQPCSHISLQEPLVSSFEKLLFITLSPPLLTRHEIVHYKIPNCPYSNHITDVCGDAL